MGGVCCWSGADRILFHQFDDPTAIKSSELSTSTSDTFNNDQFDYYLVICALASTQSYDI